jgi:hypothetical protein
MESKSIPSVGIHGATSNQFERQLSGERKYEEHKASKVKAKLIGRSSTFLLSSP